MSDEREVEPRCPDCDRPGDMRRHHPSVCPTRGKTIVIAESLIAEQITAAVAAERARCLASVAEVETRRDYGAAINACRDIADAIKEGK